MSFCTKCGQKLLEDARFCSGCGKPIANITDQNISQPITQPVVNPSVQPEVQPLASQEPASSAVVFKYQKSVMFMMLTEPLDVTLDRQLHFSVSDSRDICYNVAPGEHTLSAFVPYLAGMKYGEVTKSFKIGENEILEIMYKPPAAVFLQGIISIRKVK